MTSTLALRYRCQNPDCRAEIETDVLTEATAMPICSKCGSPMKKLYTTPVFKELDGHPAFTWVRRTRKRA